MINYLMGLCFVAATGGVAVKFIAWWANSYPVTLIVAVVAVVAVWVWCVYEERRR